MEARSITREFLHFIWIGRSCKAASHFEKIKSEFRMQKQETLQIVINGPYPGGGGGGGGIPIWNRRGCSSEILNLTPKGDHLGVAQAFCDL